MAWDPTAPGSTAQQDNAGTVATPATNAAVVPSAARTTSGNSVSLPLLTGAKTLNVLADVTAASGSTPSLALSIEWSHDGTTWFTPETADSFTAITAATKKVKAFTVKAPFYRVVWAITGTTPSFTFAVHSHAH